MLYPHDPRVGLSWWMASRAPWGTHTRRWGFIQAPGVSGGVRGFEDDSEPPGTLRDQVTQLQFLSFLFEYFELCVRVEI